jgi:hypothetical protein
MQHEAVIRLLNFLGVLILMLLAEFFWPRRIRPIRRRIRCRSGIGFSERIGRNPRLAMIP